MTVWMRGRQVALTYGAAVLLAALALQLLPLSRRTSFVLSVSTDPDALLAHPVRSLLLSPFVLPDLRGLLLLPVAVATLIVLQRCFGARTALVTAVLGHVLVSVGVAVLLERDVGPPESLGRADVGVSYVLATTAAASLAAGPRWFAWTAAVIGAAALAGLVAVGRGSTDAGHLTGWLLGVAVSWWLSRRAARQLCD